MKEQEQLQLNKQKQVQEFKTEQIQESVQTQRTMFDQNVPVPVQQEKNDRRSNIVQRKYGIFNKDRDVEEVYSTTKEEKQDTYARERKDAFRQQLLSMSADHLKENYNPEYTEVMNKIREYAEIEPKLSTNRKRGRVLMEARKMIQNYIDSKTGTPEMTPEEAKALEVMKLYELWFRTFSDGNMEAIPVGANEKKVVGDDEPEIRNSNKSGTLEAAYADMSDYALFAGEPSIEDVQQGFVGDCYLIAGLISVLSSDPMAIKRAMRDNGKTVTVRFFEPVLGSNGEKMGVRPIYVTVNKTLPRLKRIDREAYIFGGLWAGMIEKAYVAWGGHTNEAARKKQATIKEDIKAKYLQEGIAEEEAEKKSEQEAWKTVRSEKTSYEQIVGGDSQDFVEILTGKESEKKKYLSFKRRPEFYKIVTDTMTGAVQKEMDALLHISSENKENEEFKGAFTRFSKEAGEDTAKKLLELTKNHPKEIESIIKLVNQVFRTFSSSIIEQFYETDWMSDDDKIRAKKPVYLEDIQKVMRQKINECFFKSNGKVKHRFGNQYKPVLDAMVERMLHRIEEEQDERLDSGNPEDEARVQFVHSTESKKYSKFAEREFKDIQESLKRGDNLTITTNKFAGSSRFGLNGEGQKDGLVELHAYTVLGTHEMDGRKFVKLRNPWAKSIVRYIRTVNPDGTETFQRETDNSDGTDGIFFLELNEFIAKTEFLGVNKNLSPNIVS